MEKDKDGYYLVLIFSPESSRLGYAYDAVAKAVSAAIAKGGIPVTYGDKGSSVDIERICGYVQHPVFLEEAEIIQGLFKATPAKAEFIDKLMAHQPTSFSIRPVSPRFGLRGRGSVDKNGKHVLEHLVSIDLLIE